MRLNVSDRTVRRRLGSHVRRWHVERLHPDCFGTTAKHVGKEISTWDYFFGKGVASLTQLKGDVNQKVYENGLLDHDWPSLKNPRANINQKDNNRKQNAESYMSYITGLMVRYLNQVAATVYLPKSY